MVSATIFATLVVLSAHAIYSHPQGPGGYYQPPPYQSYPMYQGPPPQYPGPPMQYPAAQYQGPPPQNYPAYQAPPPPPPPPQQNRGGYQPTNRPASRGRNNRRKAPYGAHKFEDKKWNNATNEHYDLQHSILGYSWLKIPYDRDTTYEGTSSTVIERSEWP
ncbi:uncharacterized protein LOC141527831 [Cotesia typhae]|uniref:uncharacterized protein LOC141527831 n=1 Tax=Cotesia typhae TaxID=2053667 RepID=UPI003D693BDE